MDFLSRGGDRRPAQPMNTTGHAAAHPTGKRKHIDWAGRTVRLELFIVLVGTALLLAALSLWLATGNFNSTESKQLEPARYQAVFLTNNQVYFGKVTSLNDKSVVLTDVFYIETPNNSNQNNASASNTNYTLRKLGDSELHAPEDKMVISRSQVIFWENLKDSSQVVTKIKEYKKNPSAAQQNNSSQNSSNSQNPSSSNSNNQQNNSQTSP